MGRKAKLPPPPGGILICRKPAGPTSVQVLGRIRRLSGIKKAGHCGTLDPFADGVLPIALGRATNMVRYMENYDKVYRVLLHLGEATDTQDLSGKVVGGCRPDAERAEALLADDARLIREAMARLTGKITQETPAYSAAKIDGRPMYEYARAGEKVQGKKREVEIYRAELLAAGKGSLSGERLLTPETIPGKEFFPGLAEEKEAWDKPYALREAALWLAADVHCSKGTYIRTWCDDLGKLLGTGAYAARLRRLRSGPYQFADSVSPEELEEAIRGGLDLSSGAGKTAFFCGAETARPDFPVIELEKTDAVCLLQGKMLRTALPESGEKLFRVFSGGVFLGIARRRPKEGDGVIAAERMFTDIENFACRFDEGS